MPINQQILLDNRPQGEAVASNFKLVSAETPALADGQVLVRHHYLSLDPYMRGRMNESKSYAASQALGEVMIGVHLAQRAELHLMRNPLDRPRCVPLFYQRIPLHRPHQNHLALQSRQQAISFCYF